MKTAVVCCTIAGLAFVAMAYQAGFFGSVGGSSGSMSSPVKKPQGPPPAPFPDALTQAGRGRPVPEAAEFKGGSGPHPLVFLNSAGQLHESWQDRVREEWQATTVEKTELVVVLGKQRKIFIDRTDYPNGAPPIWRYKYELDVTVYAAKSGQVLGRKRFQSMPRSIRSVESWELTELGLPVAMSTVFSWVASSSLAGFPPDASTGIATTVADQ